MRTGSQPLDDELRQIVELLKSRGEHSVEITVRCDGRVDFWFSDARGTYTSRAIRADLHADTSLPLPSAVIEELKP